MSVFEEILEWTKSLPDWQSDAISRLLTKRELSSIDYVDLLALLKSSRGIVDPSERKPSPLTEDQIPAPPKGTSSFQLHAVKNLERVNAIAEKQRLECQPTGLTIIYGDNGAGKSGYSRVLKRACRARDQAEAILPNANLTSDPEAPPSATFEISVNGKVSDVAWIDGTPAPPELSSLAVFDARCARAYLDSEDDYSYVPYGLDVFQDLAAVCQKLKDMVEAEKQKHAVDLGAFATLHGDTKVGKLIEVLSHRTPVAAIDKLTSLSQEELDEYQQLADRLKEENPADKAKSFRQRSARLRALAKRISEKFSLMSPASIARLRGLSDENLAAKQAANLAAKQFTKGKELLPGSGSPAWKTLFESARAFAVESHPGHKFPNLPADSLCPLCQQPLRDGAARLIHFQEYVQQDAEKKFEASKRALNDAATALANQNIQVEVDKVTVDEIGTLDEALAEAVRQIDKELVDRKQAIQSALSSGEWEKLGAEPATPAEPLTMLADKLEEDAKALDEAADESARAKMRQAHSELDARLKLKQVAAAVKKAIENLAHCEKLGKCVSDLRTNHISRKASDLTEKVVSKQLEQALNDEFKSLGIGSLKVALQSRSERGRALHKLKLKLPKTPSPANILSEGEQRALAIGSFLAEVNLSGQQGGIIFDDPVSSLDHRRRERVARRLVTEASTRQVIVFTHDIYFLCIMVDEASNASTPIATQSLIRTTNGFGVADAELPFEGLNTRRRIGVLKTHQQQIDKLYRDGNEQEHKAQTVDAYFKLRLAWERAVEEVLLGETVIRFRKGIETQRLAVVQVNDEDYDQVYAGMSKCSNYAHDKAMMGGVAVPDPDELLEDINALETWRASVDQRNQVTRKRRKK